MKPKKFMGVILLAMIITITNCANVQAVTTLPSGNTSDDIGKKIESFVKEHQDTTAGMSVSVFDDQSTIYQNYFGKADIKNNIAVNADTVFEWGSTSKLLVWVSVMQLWEQGKIDLNADVRDYLPDGFLTNLKYEKPVTMTNLMNHNAGFEELLVDVFLQEGEKIPDLKSALQKHEPEQIYEPGTYTAYSNWGVALAGYIVECISGEPYDQYVREHIFQVLGMEHTAICPDLSDNPWVKEKRKELKCYVNMSQLTPDFYHLSLYPAGMCTGTIADFQAFAQSLLKDDCPLFESNTTLVELFSPTSYFGDTGIPRNCHGFWNIPFKASVLGHGGNTRGCTAYLLIDRKDHLGSVVMINQNSETIYSEKMMELIYGSFENSDTIKPTTVPKGIYRPARIVKIGPSQLLGAVSISGYDKSDLNDLFSYRIEDGLGIVSEPYEDMLQVPTGQLVFECFLLGSYAIGLLVALFYIISWPIGYIRRRHKETEKDITSAIKLRRVSAGLQWLLALMLVGMVFSMTAYETGSTYAWMSAVCGIAGIAMLIVMVLLIRQLIKNHSKNEIFLSGFTIFYLVIGIINIIYWDLYMFWIL